MIELIVGVIVGMSFSKKIKRYLPHIPPFTRLVKFEDGKYGVRKGYIVYFYRNFGYRDWVTTDSRFFGNCKVSKTEAEAFFTKVKHGEPV